MQNVALRCSLAVAFLARMAAANVAANVLDAGEVAALATLPPLRRLQAAHVVQPIMGLFR